MRTGIATFDLEPPPLEYWRARLASTEPGDHLLVAEARRRGLSATRTPRRTGPAGVRAHPRDSVYLAADARRPRPRPARCTTSCSAALRADGMHVALAVIALPNPASEALHRACGFEQVGVLPEVGYKFDRWIDTAFWALKL